MTYQAYETSASDGSPVECYEITAGAQVFRFTSDATSQVIGANSFTPTNGLKRTSTAEGANVREHDFEFQIPTANELAQLFVGVLPGFRVRVKLYRFHRDDLPTPEVVQAFDGYIQSSRFGEGGTITVFIARPVLASQGHEVPRRSYTAHCNHDLYGPGCQVDDTDPAFRASSLSVDSQDGNVLTVAAGLSGVYADGFMSAGYVESIGGNDFRLILDHTGDVLTLLYPFSSTPSTVNVFAGCSHKFGECVDKFDNGINFGGFFIVPKENPFEEGIA